MDAASMENFDLWTHDNNPSPTPSITTHPSSPVPSDISFEDAVDHAEQVPELVLQTIINHLDRFEHKLVDSELRLERTNAIDKRIGEVLNRQLQDGLLTYSEFINLSHVKFLWTSTLGLLTTSYFDRKSSRRRAIANLVDLYTLNEIGRDQLLDIIYKI